MAKAPTKSTKSKTVKAARLKRGRLFYRLVRANLQTALVRERGYDRADARDLVDALTDAEIDAQADRSKIEAIGDGGFLAWLIDHLDEIRSLVELLLGLFSLFATQAVLSARSTAVETQTA